MTKIQEAIQKIVKPPAKMEGIVCTVLSVDTDNYTCDCEPVSGDSNILDVRLTGGGAQDVLMIPAVGSFVIVEMINVYTGYVAMYGKLESIQLMDGAHGGMVKVTELVGRLNSLENDINNLKSILTSWAPVAGDGGASLKALLTSYNSATLAVTVNGDIENETVTHGNA